MYVCVYMCVCAHALVNMLSFTSCAHQYVKSQQLHLGLNLTLRFVLCVHAYHVFLCMCRGTRHWLNQCPTAYLKSELMYGYRKAFLICSWYLYCRNLLITETRMLMIPTGMLHGYWQGVWFVIVASKKKKKRKAEWLHGWLKKSDKMFAYMCYCVHIQNM